MPHTYYALRIRYNSARVRLADLFMDLSPSLPIPYLRSLRRASPNPQKDSVLAAYRPVSVLQYY